MKHSTENTPQPFQEWKFKMGSATVISRTWYYPGSEEDPESEGQYCSLAFQGNDGVPMVGLIYHDKERRGMMCPGKSNVRARQ